jgi:sugar phosphate isomerase/epimerase
MLATVDGMLSPQGSPERNKAFSIIEQSLGIARAMHIPMMHIPNFGRAEIKSDDDMTLTAELFRRACVLAEGSGVEIATENPFGVEGHQQLFARTNHPGLKFLLDTRNAVIRGYSASALVEQLYPRMCNQIHVKDGRVGVKGSLTLGTGDGDFAASAQALVAAGFDGYIISENRYEQDAARLLAEDMAVLKSYFG